MTLRDTPPPLKAERNNAETAKLSVEGMEDMKRENEERAKLINSILKLMLTHN